MSAAWNAHRARVALKEPEHTGIGTNRPVEVQPWRYDRDNDLLQRVLLNQREPLRWSDIAVGLLWFASATVASWLLFNLVPVQ